MCVNVCVSVCVCSILHPELDCISFGFHNKKCSILFSDGLQRGNGQYWQPITSCQLKWLFSWRLYLSSSLPQGSISVFSLLHTSTVHFSPHTSWCLQWQSALFGSLQFTFLISSLSLLSVFTPCPSFAIHVASSLFPRFLKCHDGFSDSLGIRQIGPYFPFNLHTSWDTFLDLETLPDIPTSINAH